MGGEIDGGGVCGGPLRPLSFRVLSVKTHCFTSRCELVNRDR